MPNFEKTRKGKIKQNNIKMHKAVVPNRGTRYIEHGAKGPWTKKYLVWL